MLEVALKLLKELTSHSYQAYIVGGFVRDYLLGIESNDIDIATNATPKQIKEIFEDSCLPNEDYGSVTVVMKGVIFEITTFRREIEYINNRRPLEIQYIDDLYEDLLRRDFVINTLCMDDNGKILDYLGGQEDIKNHVIHTVGDAHKKFLEDSLRILRAVRFATLLDFQLDDDIIKAIQDTKYLLYHLSFFRKKEELDKIFTSPNCRKGIELLLELGLDKELEIPNLRKVLDTDAVSLIGIWTILDVQDKYTFQRNEKELIADVKKVLPYNQLDPYVLYQYGLYVNSVAGEIKRIDIKDITEAYNHLIIKSRSDIDIDANTIMELLHRKPGKYIKEIYSDLEKEILYRRLINKKEILSNYIVNHYMEESML